VALLSSALAISGALAAARRARLVDATILRILGATRGRLALIFLAEYALLGAATALFGVAAGTLAAYVVVVEIMGFDFAFAAGPAFAAAGGGLALTVGLGLVGAWRILGRRPAEVLREL
jgi:putative ABC transport system permease protein